MSAIRSVAVFFLGGTISMAGHDRGVVARLGARELVESVPGLSQSGVELHVQDVRRLPSACLRYDDVLQCLVEAERHEAGGADGVVVVQGTDTIEETAFLIDLLWDRDAPIVLTGAMRNPTLAGADGPANLLAAVTVAASPRCRGLGALVVLNDEIHAARHVTKRHSSSLAAFASPNLGPLGRLVEGEPVLHATVERRPVLRRPDRIGARVPVVTTVFSDGGELLDGLEQRCDGLVVAGFGVGHVPDWLADTLGHIATRIPVVLASRTGAGPVLTRTYGYTGSETDLLARGLIPAGTLDPLKARILLAVLLAGGADRASIAAAFAQSTGSGIQES